MIPPHEVKITVEGGKYDLQVSTLGDMIICSLHFEHALSYYKKKCPHIFNTLHVPADFSALGKYSFGNFCLQKHLRSCSMLNLVMTTCSRQDYLLFNSIPHIAKLAFMRTCDCK